MQTLQAVLDRLTAFAAERQPDQFVPTLSLLPGGGAILVVHYTGSGSSEVPREAHLFFGDDSVFRWGFVYDPGQFAHALEEGLDYDHAEAAARKMVDSVGAVVAYLDGQAYELAK